MSLCPDGLGGSRMKEWVYGVGGEARVGVSGPVSVAR